VDVLRKLTHQGAAPSRGAESAVHVVSLYPADQWTFSVDAVVPANSSLFALVDIALPLDTLSAVMTALSISVVRAPPLFSSQVK